MGKIIFKMVGELVEITGNAEIDGVLATIIGVFAFAVAFDWVGKLFDAIGWYDSSLMSDVHWLIRTGVFLGIAYVLKKFIEFVTWLFSFQWWVYLIAFIVVIFGILCAYYARYRHQKRKNFQLQLEENDVPEVSMITEENGSVSTEMEDKMKNVIDYDRRRCPRCNSMLVRRHGTYGDFYGCDAYGRTGCRYTRKYL